MKKRLLLTLLSIGILFTCFSQQLVIKQADALSYPTPEKYCDGSCHFDKPIKYIDIWKLN